jgi:hypothetical protein
VSWQSLIALNLRRAGIRQSSSVKVKRLCQAATADVFRAPPWIDDLVAKKGRSSTKRALQASEALCMGAQCSAHLVLRCEGTDAKGCWLVLDMTAHITSLAIVHCCSESSANLDVVFDRTRRAGFDPQLARGHLHGPRKIGIASVQKLSETMPRFCIQHLARNIEKEKGSTRPLNHQASSGAGV